MGRAIRRACTTIPSDHVRPAGLGTITPATTNYSQFDDLKRLFEGLGLSRAAVVGGYEWSSAFLERGTWFRDARQREGVEGFFRALMEDPHFIPDAATQPELDARARTLLRENFAIFSHAAGRERGLEPPAVGRLDEIETNVCGRSVS